MANYANDAGEKRRSASNMTTKQPTEMNYLEWSRVIDELQNVIRGAKLTIEINAQFLAAATKERERFPEPKKPDQDGDDE